MTTIRVRRAGFRTLELLAALLLAPLALYFLVREITGQDGLATIGDDQVAVVANAWTGERELVTTPGYRPYLPWIEEVHGFDKTPNGLVFAGNTRQGPNHVPRLIARARDGATYWFEEFPLVYALRTDRAPEVLDDAGPGDAFKERLVAFYARSILRDELGRFSTEEIAQVHNLRDAVRAALLRLNVALAPHGIEVLEVSTPKASFDKAYEDHIQRRKINDQEAERLAVELQQLAEERRKREAAAVREKEVEFKKLEGNLERDVRVAEKELIRARADADNYWTDKVRAAQAGKLDKERLAAVLRDKYIGSARDLSNQGRELELHGELAVRRSLVEKLAGIEFTLVPYSRDPAPQRLEVQQSVGAAFQKP